MAPPESVHLFAPVADSIATFEQARNGSEPLGTVIDLSTGYVGAASRLRVEREEAEDTRWIDGADFAGALADASQDRYLDWLAEVSDAELYGGKSIKEWFVYNGEISLWWFTDMAVKHPRRHPYLWLFYMVDVARHLLRDRAVAREACWHLWVADRATGQALRAGLASAGVVDIVIHVIGTAMREPAGKRLARVLAQPFKHIARSVRMSSKNRSLRAEPESVWDGGEGKRVLFVTKHPSDWKPVAEDERFDDAVEYFDQYLGALPWALERHGVATAWLDRSLMPSTQAEWIQLVERQGMRDGSPWLALGPAAVLRLLLSHAKWALTYAYLFGMRRSRLRWSYGAIPMGPWLVDAFRELALGGGVAKMIKVEEYRHTVEALQPDTVVYRNEMYESGRMLSAALKGRVDLMGIQHGMIGPGHTVYQFRTSDTYRVGNSGWDHVHSCPMPDVFATFGTYNQELFERGGGGAKAIAVGGVRHDYLADSMPTDEAEKRKRRERLGLPTDVPVVLLCTGLAEEAGALFETLVEALGEADIRAHVVVKFHRYGGQDRVKAVAERRCVSSVTYFEDSLHPLMAASDVMVGAVSTTIIEAYLFGLPAITLATSKNFESYPFTEEGIGVPVTNVHEMAEELATALHTGSEGQEAFMARRNRVLRRHLWNHDGGATSRIAALIHEGLR